MAQVTTGDQADTPIMDILTGIAGSGRAVTGAIGRPATTRPREVGLFRVEESPQPERRNSTVIL